MDQDLTGKVALVTGSSKGIGKGIALELARRGCSVMVNYHGDQAGAEATAAGVRALGAKAATVHADVGSASDVEAMFTAHDKEFGRLDFLVNNAGTQTWKALLDLTEQEWDRVLDTNLKGCFLCTQQAGRRMQSTGGSIVNIGSGCNKVAFPHLVNYTASKGGIEQFTKVSAVELGKYQIRVNCVAPGSVEVERTKDEAGDYDGTWSKVTPLGRIGKPEDIGKAVYFFCSELSAFVSGQTLYVDGGLFAKPYWPYDY